MKKLNFRTFSIARQSFFSFSPSMVREFYGSCCDTVYFNVARLSRRKVPEGHELVAQLSKLTSNSSSSRYG